MQSQHEEDKSGAQGRQGNYDEMSMEELLEQSFDLQPIEKGAIIKGTVVSVSSGELLVNIGSKYEGIIRARDMERIPSDFIDQLSVGDEIPVYILHLQDEEGYVELSLNRALVEEDWVRAQEAFEQSETFEGEVVSTNKGGLIVNFGAVRGFVPGSQLANIHNTRSGKANQWNQLIGETLMLKIIEVDRRRNRLILSERVAMEELQREEKLRLLRELRVGDVRSGRVSSLADFGAFVDLGGAEGLIHLSELAWVQVSHPREVLKVGEEIEVYVLSIDQERQRIGLSLKQLQPEPWAEVIDRYQVDQIIPAEITKLTTFGAFARVDNVIEGLIHISELSHRPINHPREVVKEGEKVEVCIISIDPDKRRMGLSLKQASHPEVEWVDGDLDDAEEVDSEAADSVDQVNSEGDDDNIKAETTADAVVADSSSEDNSDEAEEPDPEAIVA